MTAVDSLVDAYLDRLESELAGVPRAGRREVLDEIEAHIAEARAELSAHDETEMRNLLERLGDPAEIAAEVRDRFGVQRPRTTWREIGALILLPLGGVEVPVAGWIAGVVLLWLSDAWTSRDKLVGTLLIPGGLVGPVLLVLVASNTGGGVCHSTFFGRADVLRRRSRVFVADLPLRTPRRDSTRRRGLPDLEATNRHSHDLIPNAETAPEGAVSVGVGRWFPFSIGATTRRL